VKPEQQRVVLRPWLSVFVAATSSAFAFFFLACIALIPLGINRNAYAWSVVGAVTALILVVSVVRVRCVVTSEGIEVVNLWRSYWVPWKAVLRIESAEGWIGAAFFLSVCSPLRIITSDGRKITVQASLVNADHVARVIERGTGKQNLA